LHDTRNDAAAATSAETRTRKRPVDDWMVGVAPSTIHAPRKRARPVDDWTAEPPTHTASRNELAVQPAGGAPTRRTITITGHGAEPPRSTRTHDLDRRRTHERNGHHKPDRIAMWAVLLGIALAVAAATSSHAAVLAAHVALSLTR
jgi:hypothetical protein